jgi:hypothetical protein
MYNFNYKLIQINNELGQSLRPNTDLWVHRLNSLLIKYTKREN